MFAKSKTSETSQSKRVSEVIREVEDIVGPENMQVQLDGDRFPQLRVSINRNFLFLRVSDFDAESEVIAELKELGWTPTKNGHNTATLQYRRYYDVVQNDSA